MKFLSLPGLVFLSAGESPPPTTGIHDVQLEFEHTAFHMR
jgi:hypothetical protein